MSKLVEKLKQLSRVAAPPMGFRPVSITMQNVSMLLIAYLNRVDIDMAGIVVSSGVDAVLMSQEAFRAEELKQVIVALKDMPVGVVLKEASYEDVAQMAESGCDFVVFSPKASTELLQIEGTGKILEVKPSLDPGLIRAINDLPLPIDGVIIEGSEPCVTVEYLLICQRFCELVDKPLLVSLPSSVSAAQLNSLWQAGIDGIVVSGEQPKETLAELKKTISNLPRRVRKRSKVAAVLPPLFRETGVEVEEEEEI